jgi:hypothetical protein
VTLDETMAYENTMELSDDDETNLSEDENETIDESIAIDENFERINKSKLPKYQNGNGNRYQSFNRTGTVSAVTSSTPNGPRNNISRSRRVQNKSSFEISDDDE